MVRHADLFEFARFSLHAQSSDVEFLRRLIKSPVAITFQLA